MLPETDDLGFGDTSENEGFIDDNLEDYGESDANEDHDYKGDYRSPSNDIETPIKKQRGENVSPVQADASEDMKQIEITEKNVKYAPTKRDTSLFSSEASESRWESLNLSKPLLRALVDMKYICPTLIQQRAIPVALEGRDILGSAQTGSGKTAAFLLPICERLCRSPQVLGRKRSPTGGYVGGAFGTKALILLPTRELALQCSTVVEKLTKYTHIISTLIAGGLARRAQEVSLRHQPDIVVATPGRVLDLLMNSQNVHMELLEIIVLDEADRLLELGFRDECLRILKHCAPQRQTMLFSATMDTAITDLASLALKKPVTISTTSSACLPNMLQQIFWQLPMPGGSKGSSSKILDVIREAAIVHLLVSGDVDGENEQDVSDDALGDDFVSENERSDDIGTINVLHKKRGIIFFRTKREVHRVANICSLLKISCVELHGDLSQKQRIEAMEAFQGQNMLADKERIAAEVKERDTEQPRAQFLLCSELAARGLDIKDVDFVINTKVPPEASRYVHQVGRTARIGHKGIAVTFFTAEEKKMLRRISKAAAKGSAAPEPIVIKASVSRIKKYIARINSMRRELKRLERAEQAEREMQIAERDLKRAENIQKYKTDIFSSPANVWYTNKRKRT